MHADELPVSTSAAEPGAAKNPATDALEAAKAAEVADSNAAAPAAAAAAESKG